jgi:hypothetical protein
MPKEVFHFQGSIHDKLWHAHKRPAGHRMFRGKCLSELISLVQEHTRVEASLLGRYKGIGKKSASVDEMFGLHDYEQWYSDLYRKGQMHSVKHKFWGLHIQRWRKSQDMDLRAAYAGWHGKAWDVPEKAALDPHMTLSEMRKC